MTHWKPISSAPKDGTEIIVLSSFTEVHTSRWMSADEHAESDDYCCTEYKDNWSHLPPFIKDVSEPEFWIPFPSDPKDRPAPTEWR